MATPCISPFYDVYKTEMIDWAETGMGAGSNQTK